MRLIDADKIGERSKVLLEHGCSMIEYACAIVNEIRNAPTIDAVPVVRCKDCVKCELCYPEKRKGEEARAAYVCHRGKRDKEVSVDDFCSYGKRRGGDGEC